MAEVLGVVSAALGLLPLAVDVAKGFNTLRSALKSAKSCDKDLDTLSIDVRTQERLFINECELILHMVCPNPEDPRRMTRDLENRLWHDPTLEVRVQDCLSRSYEQCIEIVKAMRLAQQFLESDLEPLRAIQAERREVGYDEHQFVIFPDLLM